MQTTDPAYTKTLAYGMLLLIMFLLSRTALGYKTIYYILWLVILGLLIRNAAQLAKILQPITEGRND